VEIRWLSRFVAAAERRQVVHALAAGTVDVVIGAHRLLGADVRFRDLEIRSTGSLLGAEQHGHLRAVGYQTFCHLLEEAAGIVKVRRGATAYELVPDSAHPAAHATGVRLLTTIPGASATPGGAVRIPRPAAARDAARRLTAHG